MRRTMSCRIVGSCMMRHVDEGDALMNLSGQSIARSHAGTPDTPASCIIMGICAHGMPPLLPQLSRRYRVLGFHLEPFEAPVERDSVSRFGIVCSSCFDQKTGSYGTDRSAGPSPICRSGSMPAMSRRIAANGITVRAAFVP